jgi:histidinol-phosphate aminotransferase
MITPQPGILKITPYKSGGFIADEAKIHALASNENLLGPSPKVLDAFENASKRIKFYPDQAIERLKNEIAITHDLDPKRIIVGNGSEEILQLFGRAYAGPGDEVLMTKNCFPTFHIIANAVGATPVFAPEHHLTTDIDALLNYVTDETRILFLANPNNPTGTYIPKNEVKRLCDNLPQNVLLVLDSAYSEYVTKYDYSDGRELVDDYPNVVMTRTFSKIYALAGLRLGWGYCSKEVTNLIERLRLPFNVNAIAQEVGITALQDREFINKSRAHNTRWLAWFNQQMTELGLNAHDTITNFALIEFPQAKAAIEAHKLLLKNHILTRPLMGDLHNCLRITIGTENNMRHVVNTLKSTLLQRC